jgi:hypothetical protein
MFQVPGLLIPTWSIHPSLSITFVTDLEFGVPYTITDALTSVSVKLPVRSIPKLLLWTCPSMNEEEELEEELEELEEELRRRLTGPLWFPFVSR